MSQGDIGGSPAEIRNLATQVNQSAENLNQIVQQMTGTFNGSSGYWRGNAREQFAQAFQEWNGSWGKMHESLQQMQNLINQWATGLEELDRSVHRG